MDDETGNAANVEDSLNRRYGNGIGAGAGNDNIPHPSLSQRPHNSPFLAESEGGGWKKGNRGGGLVIEIGPGTCGFGVIGIEHCISVRVVRMRKIDAVI